MRIFLFLLLSVLTGVAAGALPNHSVIDVPNNTGHSTNNSEQYIPLDVETPAKDSSGNPGLYQWSDLANGNFTPTVQLSYLEQVDATHGVIELGDGSGIKPILVLGNMVYGNRIYPSDSSVIGDLYKCPVADLETDPQNACTLISDQQAVTPIGETASASGWFVARDQDTSSGDRIIHPPEGSGLPTKTLNIDTGSIVSDLRTSADGEKVYALVTSLNTGGSEVIVITRGASDWTYQRVGPELSAAPTPTSGANLVPVAISRPKAANPGTGEFRLVFAERLSNVQDTSALWTADFEEQTGALVTHTHDENNDSYFKLTGSAESQQGLWGGLLGILRSRISNDGVLLFPLADDGSRLLDIGRINLDQQASTLDSVETGAGISRSEVDLVPESPGSDPFVGIAISECGNVSVSAAASLDDVSTWEATLFQRCSAQVNNEVSIDTPSEPIDPGETGQITVDVLLDSQTVHGIDMTCSADDQALQLVEGNLGSLFGADALVVGPTANGNDWQVAVSRSGTDEPLEASGVFATLTYNVLFTTADTQINCTAEASNGDGESVPVNVQSGTVSVDDGIHGGTGTVSGQVELPVGDDHSGITVSIHRDGNQYSTTTDANGNFNFGNVRDGAFSLTYQADQYVADCDTARVVSGGSVDLGTTTMLAGDINADGIIDIGDFTLLASSYGLSSGDADFDARTDLNGDGEVDIRDLSTLGSHFGLNVCDPSNETLGCGFDSLEDGKPLPGSYTQTSVSGMSLEVEAASEDGSFGTPSLTGVLKDSVPSLTDGQTYFEATYDGASSLDENVAMAIAATDSNGGSGAIVRVMPQSDEVEARVNEQWVPLFSGVTVNPGYTVGIAVDHDTGAVVIQDSAGNSTTLSEGSVPVDQSMYAAMGGQPGLQEGDTVSVTMHVSPDNYVLTPPSESQDWCGSAL